jgi:hypothetical protein
MVWCCLKYLCGLSFMVLGFPWSATTETTPWVTQSPWDLYNFVGRDGLLYQYVYSTCSSPRLVFFICYFYVKVKLFLCLIKQHTMKTYGEVKIWQYAFLPLPLPGTEWYFHTWQLYPYGNSTWYSLDCKLGGHRCSGCDVKGKSFCSLLWIKLQSSSL